MEPNLKTGGFTPSAIALKDSLSQKPDTLPEPTMLTPSQRELLLEAQKEIDERLDQSPRLKALLFRMRNAAIVENGDLAMDEEQ